MKRTAHFSAGFLLFVAVAAAVARSGLEAGVTPPSTAPANDHDHFAVINDQNMFLKERVRRDATSRPATSRPTEPLLTPEQRYVLRGVVYEDDTFHAYFENLQSSEMTQAVVGTALAGGHVSELSIDAVAFENEGLVVWVKVGDDLTGQRGRGTPTSRPSDTTVAADGSTPAVTPGASSDVLERMRQRRLQSLGGAK